MIWGYHHLRKHPFFSGRQPWFAQENPTSPESQTNNKASRVDSATYEFDHSMWDAALLVPWVFDFFLYVFVFG